MTDWGDRGHHQQWPISLVGIAEAMGAAWAGKPCWNGPAISRHAFADESGLVADWLHELGLIDRHLRDAARHPERDVPLSNRGCLNEDLYQPWARQDWCWDPPGWQQAADRLQALVSKRPELNDPLVYAELEQTLGLAGFAIDRAFSPAR